MPYDLVIEDTEVVDGSGMPAYTADVSKPRAMGSLRSTRSDSGLTGCTA